MRRIAITMVAALALSATAGAGPLDWLSHHKRILGVLALNAGAVGIHAAALHHCRHYVGVEHCDEHYGEAWAFYGVLTSFNMVVAPALAEACWRGGQGKFCYFVAFTGSAFQAGLGVRDWTISTPTSRDTDAALQRLGLRGP